MWNNEPERLEPVDAPQSNAGAPNDEAIQGHRLYHLGLRPCSAFQVMNSSSIAEMEMAHRVHPYHDVGAYRTKRHFIFTFHDTTLEFADLGFRVEFRRGPIRELIADLWDASEY